MANVIDMVKVRRADAMAREAFRLNPNVLDRLTYEVAEMIYAKDDKPIVVSVRMPKALADRVESLARKLAFSEDRRITRTSLMVELIKEGTERLEQAPSISARLDQSDQT